MAVPLFPPVEQADPDGLLALGGDLSVSSLLHAYLNGIFPWPIAEELLAWFAPPERAVLFLDEFHLSRRFQRTRKSVPFTVRIDTNFRSVVERCAELKNRGTQDGTWITEQIIEAYCALFNAGYCHSFETYLNGELVGGVYGVQIGQFFAAESAFYRSSGASMVAMCELVNYLKHNGVTWCDCQILTPFSESLGARLLPREQFMQLLRSSLPNGDLQGP